MGERLTQARPIRLFLLDLCLVGRFNQCGEGLESRKKESLQYFPLLPAALALRSGQQYIPKVSIRKFSEIQLNIHAQ